MKIAPVDEIPNEMLDVPIEDLRSIFDTGKQMETICLENNGIGVSAPQVGIPWNFFVYQDEDKKFHYMVNCTYEPLSENKFSGIEGCLSLLDPKGKPRRFKVLRFFDIKVSGYELVFEEKLELQNFKKVFNPSMESVIFQHEIDHQKGILISEIGEEVQIF